MIAAVEVVTLELSFLLPRSPRFSFRAVRVLVLKLLTWLKILFALLGRRGNEVVQGTLSHPGLNLNLLLLVTKELNLRTVSCVLL